MIGYRAIQEQAEPWLLVFLTAVFAVPALIAAVPAGRATDRWGGAGISALGSVVCVAGIALTLLLPGLGWLLIASMVLGLGNLMNMVGQQTVVVHVNRNGPTDGPFGFLSATASAGQALGPLLVTTAATVVGGNSDSPATTPGLVVCLVMCILCLPAYWPMRSAEREWVGAAIRRPAGVRPGAVPLSRVWPPIVVSGIVLVTLDLLYTFIPVWGVEHGVSATAVGLLLSLRAVVSMFSRIGLGVLVRRFGRRPLMAGSIAAAGVALLLFPHLGLGGAIALMVVLGVGLGIPQPLTMAWAVSLTSPALHGAVLGLRLSANRLAQIAVPLLMGALSAPFGSAAVFYANAALMTGASSVAWLRRDPDA